MEKMINDLSFDEYVETMKAVLAQDVTLSDHAVKTAINMLIIGYKYGESEEKPGKDRIGVDISSMLQYSKFRKETKGISMNTWTIKRDGKLGTETVFIGSEVDCHEYVRSLIVSKYCDYEVKRSPVFGDITYVVGDYDFRIVEEIKY